MIYVLTILIVILSVAIIVLGVKFRLAQHAHREKVDRSQYRLAEMTTDNQKKLSQLQLSDELVRKLSSIRQRLDKDLLTVQHDLIEILAKNRVVD